MPWEVCIRNSSLTKVDSALADFNISCLEAMAQVQHKYNKTAS